MSRISPGIIRRPVVAAQEPAPDALDAAQRLHAVADVHAHLGLLVHQRDRGLAIAARSASRRSLPSSRQHPWAECTVGRPWTCPDDPRPTRGRSSGCACGPSASSCACPTDDDLVRPRWRVAKAGIHPPGRDAVRDRLVDVPESRSSSASFMQHHWGGRAAWSPDDWGLNLMVELDGEPDRRRSPSHAEEVRGHCARSRPGRGSAVAFQGRGFGKEMRAAVLGFAFDGLGARVAETEAFLDNGPSNGVSRSLGYEPNGFGEPRSRGRRAHDPALPHDRGGWRARPRPTDHDRGARRLPRPVRRRERRGRGARDRAATPRLEPAAGAAPATARATAREPAAAASRPTTTASSRSCRARRHHPADVGDARAREEAAAAPRGARRVREAGAAARSGTRPGTRRPRRWSRPA